jgi:hypothetical protein
MPRIICRYDICIFNKDLTCTAKQIEYDPDQGCLTAQDRDEFDGVLDDEEEWEEDEADEAGATGDELEEEEDEELVDEDDDADDEGAF